MASKLFSKEHQPAPENRVGFTIEQQPRLDQRPRGVGHKWAKLDEETVRCIREDCKEATRLRELIRCYTAEAIGERYGISKSQVNDIKNYKYWAHVV